MSRTLCHRAAAVCRGSHSQGPRKVLSSFSQSSIYNCSKKSSSFSFFSSSSTTASSSISPWTHYDMAPLDPIIGLNEEFARDAYPQKVIVGVGAYRDDAGQPYVLPCVKAAEERIMNAHMDMEYSGIAGDPKFTQLALEFAYGKDCVALQEGRIQGVQSLSGTGGLSVFGFLIQRHGAPAMYLPDPTWGNHHAIFTLVGLPQVHKYRYYDAARSALNFTGMVEDLNQMPPGSVVLLHACAHNPTGMDPTIEQWKEVSDLMKKKQLVPFFDCAYQGFASGDATKDAAALRMFVQDGHSMATVQSFSKNFGLYGHRVGALSIVGQSPDEAKRVVSQMKLVIRPLYSNPPRYGARIVETILSDAQLTHDFGEQCKGMADRIHRMRILLRQKLIDAGSVRNWDHITRQIGMFAYSGLNQEQVKTMRSKHHLYCTLDGRISMAGVTNGNVDYIANAIHDVSKS